MNGQTTLVFYSEHAREVKGRTADKIKAILAQNAIEYNKDEKCFLCKPILNRDGTPYNFTTHAMKSNKAFGFSCSCQGWTSKYKKHMADPINMPSPGCSHVNALYEHLKRQHLHIRQEKMEGGMQMIFGVD